MLLSEAQSFLTIPTGAGPTVKLAQSVGIRTNTGSSGPPVWEAHGKDGASVSEHCVQRQNTFQRVFSQHNKETNLENSLWRVQWYSKRTRLSIL